MLDSIYKGGVEDVEYFCAVLAVDAEGFVEGRGLDLMSLGLVEELAGALDAGDAESLADDLHAIFEIAIEIENHIATTKDCDIGGIAIAVGVFVLNVDVSLLKMDAVIGARYIIVAMIAIT